MHALQELQAQQRQLEEDARDKAGSKRQIQDLLAFQRSMAQQAQLAQRLDEVEGAIGQASAAFPGGFPVCHR